LVGKLEKASEPYRKSKKWPPFSISLINILHII